MSYQRVEGSSDEDEVEKGGILREGEEYEVQASLLKPISKTRVLDLPEGHSRWNALVISDMHYVDKSFNADSRYTREGMIKSLMYIPHMIEKYKPSQIFVLGDLFNFTVRNNIFVYNVIRFFQYLPVPVILIGGNHDRHWMRENYKVWTEYSLKVYREGILKIHSSDSKDILYLLHDGENPVSVKSSMMGSSFLRALRTCYQFSTDNWMVCGHVHYPLINSDDKFACCGPFHFDERGISFLQIKEEITEDKSKFCVDLLRVGENDDPIELWAEYLVRHEERKKEAKKTGALYPPLLTLPTFGKSHLFYDGGSQRCSLS